MKKLIVKSKNLASLTEANNFEYAGDRDTIEKINSRVIRAIRTAEIAEQAAANAQAQGDSDLAAALAKRAKDLRDWADIENNKFRTDDEEDETAEKSEKGTTDDSTGKKKNNDPLKKEAEAKNRAHLPDEDTKHADDATDDDDESDSNNGAGGSNNQSNKASSGSDTDEDEQDSEEDGNQATDDYSNNDYDDGRDTQDNTDNDENDTNSPDEDSVDDENSADDDAEDDEDAEDEDTQNDDEFIDDNEEDADDDDDDDEFTVIKSNPFDTIPKYANMDLDAQLNRPAAGTKAEFDAIKEIFDVLADGEKDGARQALADILAGKAKQESLAESDTTNKNANPELLPPITKDITEISDDDFEDIINETIDAVNKVTPVSLSSDTETRIKEIEKDNNNWEANKELEDEDRANTAEEHARQRAAKKELQKYRGYNRQGVEDFKKMLKLSIASQVGKIDDETSSWSVLDHKNLERHRVAPGTYQDEKSKKTAVSIQVYLDCSGSFSEYDINRERNFLSVIDKFVSEGKVKVEIIYFANRLHTTFGGARLEGGTGAWPDIVANLQKTKPMNVLIITDSDMNGYAKYYGDYIAKGCVWYIWKKTDAPELPKKVHGIRGTNEYWLD